MPPLPKKLDSLNTPGVSLLFHDIHYLIINSPGASAGIEHRNHEKQSIATA